MANKQNNAKLKLKGKPAKRKYGLWYVTSYHYKADAIRRVRSIRNQGWLARMVHGWGYQPWHVYASKGYLPSSRKK